ncbi:hypothetical protein T492DRAFT_831332 [Pavlovales sp. CCMP2436]|nr:hypothetical protein T492DRAFT_831332 [Pavlovales sp. CCMP2436]
MQPPMQQQHMDSNGARAAAAVAAHGEGTKGAASLRRSHSLTGARGPEGRAGRVLAGGYQNYGAQTPQGQMPMPTNSRPQSAAAYEQLQPQQMSYPQRQRGPPAQQRQPTAPYGQQQQQRPHSAQQPPLPQQHYAQQQPPQQQQQQYAQPPLPQQEFVDVASLRQNAPTKDPRPKTEDVTATRGNDFEISCNSAYQPIWEDDPH